jgi:crossover junction endodeoxyribonuclease RuvC
MASNSTYRLGLNCGIVHMAIASAFIPMTLIAPATWKKAMGLGKDKDGSRLKASQLFPHYSGMWARAKDEGRCEALLIGVFGASKSMETL